MLTISDAQINALLAGVLWPFARISGVLLVDPLFSTRVIPSRVKAGLALLLTLLVAPILPSFPAIPLVSGQGIIVLIQQLLIGLSMGFVMRLVMASVEFAGMIMANQMGLGFAVVFDPLHSAQVHSLSRLLSIFVFLLFLVFDGHHMVLSTLVESFALMPIGQSVAVLTWRHLAEWGGNFISWGLRLALPVVTAMIVTNLAIGVMGRAAPQFNIFSFGFPLTIGIGFVAFYLALPMMVPVIEQIYYDGFEFILSMLKTA